MMVTPLTLRLYSEQVNRLFLQQTRSISFDNRLCLSKLFLPTVIHPKDAPKNDKLCNSQRLMIEMGLMKHAGPGTYHILPFAWRAVEKLTKLIDEQMAMVGAQKMVMPTLGAAGLWKKSNRWDIMDTELYKLKDRHGVEHCLSPTHEEAITSLVAADINLSYRNLPIRLYQISQKFRDEQRPRFGLLRTREFLMKDLYTFDTSVESAMLTYESVCEAYARLFDKLNVQYVKVQGATGEIGGSTSHEYHFLSTLGEDDIYTCSDCGYGANVETIEYDKQPQCTKGKSKEDCAIKLTKGIEVGHAFYLGKKYSEIFKTQFTNDQKQKQLVEMGCYGLGVTRILAGAIEVLSSETEIRWPSLIAPYQICIILPQQGSKEESLMSTCLSLHDKLMSDNHQLKGEIVIDDRQNLGIGKRLKNACCLGYPMVVVCGRDLLKDIPHFEVHLLNSKEKMSLTVEEVVKKASQLEGAL
ncbi:probable proline--tRNA ligase, mitochondrial [Antedon mediterranea]|uniref:probable proline--tRNA ligase, mitochondrial n=1 Tax=Antedon mediterranea TaxID=105859 RepID=UPI003AF6C49C